MDSPAIDAVVNAIVAANPRRAVALLEDWGATNGFDRLAAEMLAPSLARFSAEHASDIESPLARGYVAAKVAERCMDLIAEHCGSTWAGREQPRGRLLLGNIEDDFHGLGRGIVANFLRSDGWEVIDLGEDVLAPVFVDRALEHEVSLIGVSAMMHSTAVNILKVREEIDRRGLTAQLRLAVGGAIFCLRPELVNEVGGDGTCATAMEASALFDALQAGLVS